MSGGPLPDQIPKSLHVADRSRSVCSRQNMSAGASVYGALGEGGEWVGWGEVVWEDSREWIWREMKHIVTENILILTRFPRVYLEGGERDIVMENSQILARFPRIDLEGGERDRDGEVRFWQDSREWIWREVKDTS